jgi:hypothetical protein
MGKISYSLVYLHFIVISWLSHLTAAVPLCHAPPLLRWLARCRLLPPHCAIWRTCSAAAHTFFAAKQKAGRFKPARFLGHQLLALNTSTKLPYYRFGKHFCKSPHTTLFAIAYFVTLPLCAACCTCQACLRPLKPFLAEFALLLHRL